MIFRELNGTEESCRSYLVADERTREALIVDPVLEHVPAYLEALGTQKLRLAWTIDTHTHADHLSGAHELAVATGARTAGSPAGSVHRALREGDVVRVGEIALTVWASPGHTADSLVLVLPDRVLTGDTLFIGATGRTDLPSGDPEREWESVRRLLTLPDETLVFPGHEYQHRLSSTIGHERASNPRLTISREEFLRMMNMPRKEKPARLAEALAWNTRPLASAMSAFTD